MKNLGGGCGQSGSLEGMASAKQIQTADTPVEKLENSVADEKAKQAAAEHTAAITAEQTLRDRFHQAETARQEARLEFSDARNQAGERLGENKVLDCIRANLAEPPETILARTFALVNEYVGRAPRRDDLTLVLLKT